MMQVWIRAELEKIWVDTAEIDVTIDNCGENLKVTVSACDVVSIASDHTSDCAVYNDGSLPREHCTCGSVFYSVKRKS